MARLPCPAGDVDDMYAGKRCRLCGNDHPAAMWRGEMDIFVCTTCAIDVLPRLIADAVVSDHADFTSVLEDKNRIDKAFWEAVACRALSLGRRRDGS